MRLQIRKSLVLSFIERKFDGIDNFIAQWETLIASGNIKAGKAKDSATIYRWLNKGLPAQTQDVMSFFGALDLDPVSVLDVEKSGLLKNFQKFRLAFQTSGASPLTPLSEIFKPGPGWPSNALVEPYYSRNWSIVEFEHEPNGQNNVYAQLKIEITGNVISYHPIAFHIAYRRKGALDRMWRPYGSIIRLENLTRLVSESGDFQEKLDREDFRRVRAETYFGPGPVEFKLASLHKFALDIEIPSTGEGVVRFYG